MRSRRRSVDIRRLLAMAVLFVLLSSMLVHYDLAWQERSPYPATGEVQAQYEDHLGERTFHWFVVREVHDQRVVIESDPLVLTIEKDLAVEEGELIQVYGVLRPEHRFEPIRVVDRDPRSRLYLLGISVFGAVLTLLGFVRSWQFDPEGLVFQRRGDD